MVERRRPQVAHELRDQLERAFAVLVPRDAASGSRAGSRARWSRSAPRSGRRKRRAEVLADVAARRAVEQLDPEAHAARDHRDLLRRDVEDAQLGRRCAAAPAAARSAARRRRRRRSGRSSSGSPRTGGCAQPPCACRVAVAGHRDQPVDEVGRRLAAAAADPSAAGSAASAPSSNALTKRPLSMRRNGACTAAGPDPVRPRAAIRAARRRERGAGDLLRVQAVRRALRRVLPDRQRAGQSPRSRTRCRSRTGTRAARRRCGQPRTRRQAR